MISCQSDESILSMPNESVNVTKSYLSLPDSKDAVTLEKENIQCNSIQNNSPKINVNSELSSKDLITKTTNSILDIQRPITIPVDHMADFDNHKIVFPSVPKLSESEFSLDFCTKISTSHLNHVSVQNSSDKTSNINSNVNSSKKLDSSSSDEIVSDVRTLYNSNAESHNSDSSDSSSNSFVGFTDEMIKSPRTVKGDKAKLERKKRQKEKQLEFKKRMMNNKNNTTNVSSSKSPSPSGKEQKSVGIHTSDPILPLSEEMEEIIGEGKFLNFLLIIKINCSNTLLQFIFFFKLVGNWLFAQFT